MRTRGMQSRPQNSSIVAKLSIAGLVSINAHGRIPCAAAKCSHSGNRTAIFILTSYAFRQNKNNPQMATNEADHCMYDPESTTAKYGQPLPAEKISPSEYRKDQGPCFQLHWDPVN